MSTSIPSIPGNLGLAALTSAVNDRLRLIQLAVNSAATPAAATTPSAATGLTTQDVQQLIQQALLAAPVAAPSPNPLNQINWTPFTTLVFGAVSGSGPQFVNPSFSDCFWASIGPIAFVHYNLSFSGFFPAINSISVGLPIAPFSPAFVNNPLASVEQAQILWSGQVASVLLFNGSVQGGIYELTGPNCSVLVPSGFGGSATSGGIEGMLVYRTA